MPATCPSKSRIVEAICILLCDKYGASVRHVNRKKVSVTSRWKQVLEAYRSVRGRLLNSSRLLEDTNLVLFNINEATLVRWYKGTTRINEVKMLLQGVTTPAPSSCSATPLLQPMDRPTKPPSAPLSTAFVFEEPECSGKTVTKLMSVWCQCVTYSTLCSYSITNSAITITCQLRKQHYRYDNNIVSFQICMVFSR